MGPSRSSRPSKNQGGMSEGVMAMQSVANFRSLFAPYNSSITTSRPPPAKQQRNQGGKSSWFPLEKHGHMNFCVSMTKTQTKFLQGLRNLSYKKMSWEGGGLFSTGMMVLFCLTTRTTTWNLPGPSGTRDCINIVNLSHPSPPLLWRLILT